LSRGDTVVVDHPHNGAFSLEACDLWDLLELARPKPTSGAYHPRLSNDEERVDHGSL
jgi:hypothetical protein